MNSTLCLSPSVLDAEALPEYLPAKSLRALPMSRELCSLLNEISR